MGGSQIRDVAESHVAAVVACVSAAILRQYLAPRVIAKEPKE
jgi:hypothetical protein